MTCTRPDCTLPQEDGGGLCFGHRSAFVAELLCEVGRKHKALSVTSGGVSVSLHPEAWMTEVHEEEREPEAEPADEFAKGVPPPETSIRETVNDLPFTPEDEFGAAEDPGGE